MAPGEKWNTNCQDLNLISSLNEKGLEADVEYTLIYYPDSWPGNGLICLGRATANNGGNVHIDGLVDTGDLTDAKIAFGLPISLKN